MAATLEQQKIMMLPNGAPLTIACDVPAPSVDVASRPAPVLTFFNNKGGVGKTSLIYHLAWMYALMGKRVAAVDLDPQANLTSAFLEDKEMEEIWSDGQPDTSVYKCVKPLTETGNILPPRLRRISSNLYLAPGDVSLANYEEFLSNEWPKSMDETNLYRPMKILSSLWQVMEMAAAQCHADLVLVDVGPNLGAINRSALIAADYVIIPLGADLFSLQGLKNLGPILFRWRKAWNKRLENWHDCGADRQYPDLKLPLGRMAPLGYLCQQHGIYQGKLIKAYERWFNSIPALYRQYVLNQCGEAPAESRADPYCLGTVRHFRSLIPMAQEHHKPIFCLTSADGALGTHMNAVKSARADFEELARKIAALIEI